MPVKQLVTKEHANQQCIICKRLPIKTIIDYHSIIIPHRSIKRQNKGTTRYSSQISDTVVHDKIS